MQRDLTEMANIAHPVFVRQGWKWGFAETAHVPSQHEIERALAEIAQNCVNSAVKSQESTFCSTGRLRCEVWFDEYGAMDITYCLELGEKTFP